MNRSEQQQEEDDGSFLFFLFAHHVTFSVTKCEVDSSIDREKEE